MAATGMKIKQVGPIAKSIYPVPNHMLEQLACEFLQLYPNARLLVSTKDDLARERRKLRTAVLVSPPAPGTSLPALIPSPAIPIQ
jgi:N12 class adenine-specific DNA methylase